MRCAGCQQRWPPDLLSCCWPWAGWREPPAPSTPPPSPSSAISLIGPNRALGLLELARTRLALGRADGDAPYYEGASLDDPEPTAGYRADLQLVATDSVLREFDRLRDRRAPPTCTASGPIAITWSFGPKGSDSGSTIAGYCSPASIFPSPSAAGSTAGCDAYRSGNTEVDDRGVIYIRQGEPAERLRPFVFGAMPNESWQYVRAEGDLLFHFSSGYDQQWRR